jgi:DNA-binding SARP family transcriptional activator
MDGATDLRLLGGFSLHHQGRPLDLQMGGRRLLAFLAIARRSSPRRHVAGRLWPDVTDDRSSASLRSTLWRIKQVAPPILSIEDQHLGLLPSVRVDIHEVVDRERTLLVDYVDHHVIRLDDSLSEDLLPGWDEDWVVVERERLRQLRLHTLESMAAILIERGRWREAIDVAFAAVREEPLRETAQRRLIEAHIAEGNLVEARRQFENFRSLLARELGVQPSRSLRVLVDGNVIPTP